MRRADGLYDDKNVSHAHQERRNYAGECVFDTNNDKTKCRKKKLN